ncbi:hypothetical protein GW17_00058705, partial [Ensete ventricosum]
MARGSGEARPRYNLLSFKPRCLAREGVLLTLTHRKSNSQTFYTECTARGSMEARPRCIPQPLTP